MGMTIISLNQSETLNEREVNMELMSLFEAVVNQSPKDVPAVPSWLDDYNRRPENEGKEKLWDDKIKNSKEYQDYYRAKWAANLHNRTCIIDLVDVRDNDSLTEKQKMAINNKIIQFIRAIGDQSKNVYRALWLDYTALKVDNLNLKQGG